MQFTLNKNIALHFQEIGAPEGAPTLVFINSLGTDFRIWRDVVVALAGSCKLICYDMRGHGLSDEGKGPYSNADMVDDLKVVLDACGADKVIICGLSVGGQIAQGFALTYPERVDGLILSNTAHKIGTNESWDTRIATVERDGLSAVSDGIMKVWFTPAFRVPENPAFAGYKNMVDRQSVKGYVATCAAIRQTDFTDRVGTISVPVMCIVGDQDGSTPPKLVKELAELIPGARYEVIVNAGHIPCVEQPEAYVDLLKGFLADLKSDGDSHG